MRRRCKTPVARRGLRGIQIWRLRPGGGINTDRSTFGVSRHRRVRFFVATKLDTGITPFFEYKTRLHEVNYIGMVMTIIRQTITTVEPMHHAESSINQALRSPSH